MRVTRKYSDMAEVRPAGPVISDPTAGGLGPSIVITDETRWDARRAVTFASKRDGLTTAESADVFAALGLLPEPQELSGPASIVCPTCGAVQGAKCRTVGSRKLLVDGGYHRTRKAAAL